MKFVKALAVLPFLVAMFAGLTPVQAYEPLVDCLDDEAELAILAHGDDRSSSASCLAEAFARCTAGWGSADECAAILCPTPTTTPETTVCGVEACNGATGKTGSGAQACGSPVEPDTPNRVTKPTPPGAPSQVQPGPPDFAVNLAHVFVQPGQQPQVTMTAVANTGPFELDFLFSRLDYTKPITLTIRSATGLVSASYTFTVESWNIDGTHATAILDGVPAVVGARYEINTGSYRGTFYPLQRTEAVPGYCYGAAIEQVCITAGLCTDTAAAGLVCPGSGPCANPTSNPTGCVLGQPIVAGLGPLVDSVVADVTARAHDALRGCGVESGTTSDPTCRNLLAFAQTVPGLVLALVSDLLADCLQATSSPSSASSSTTCQDALAQVLALPGLVLDAASDLIASCGLSQPTAGPPTPSASAADTTCRDAIAAVLALPGTVLPIINGLIKDCTGQTPGTCAALVALVAGLPGQVLPIATELVKDCTASGDPDSTCRQVQATLLALPGTILGLVGPVVEECVGSTTNGFSAQPSNTTCDTVRRELGEAPETVMALVRDVIELCWDEVVGDDDEDCGINGLGVIGELGSTVVELVDGLVPDCAMAQRYQNPGCGIDGIETPPVVIGINRDILSSATSAPSLGELTHFVNTVCGFKSWCSLPTELRASPASTPSPGTCDESYYATRELSNFSDTRIHPPVTNERHDHFDNYLMAKRFYELTYGDPCSTPAPDILRGDFGYSYGWAGPTVTTKGVKITVDWTMTVAGTRIPGSEDYRYSHYLSVRPWAYFQQPTGPAQIEVRDTYVVGYPQDDPSCTSGVWEPELRSLLEDMVEEMGRKAGQALALANLPHDTYCNMEGSKRWTRLACERPGDDVAPYCKGAEIRMKNAGIEPSYNGGRENRGRTFAGEVRAYPTTNGTYTMNFWNKVLVSGVVKGPNALETPIDSYWLGNGESMTAFIRGANPQG